MKCIDIVFDGVINSNRPSTIVIHTLASKETSFNFQFKVYHHPYTMGYYFMLIQYLAMIVCLVSVRAWLVIDQCTQLLSAAIGHIWIQLNIQRTVGYWHSFFSEFPSLYITHIYITLLKFEIRIIIIYYTTQASYIPWKD